MTIPDTELEAIDARCEAATPGPWGFATEAERHAVVCAEIKPPTFVGLILHDRPNKDADAAFISGARVDLPKLLAAYRELRADKERLDWLAEKSEYWAREAIDAARALKGAEVNDLPSKHGQEAAMMSGYISKDESALSLESVKLIENEIRGLLDAAAHEIRLRYYERAWPYILKAIALKNDIPALKEPK